MISYKLEIDANITDKVLGKIEAAMWETCGGLTNLIKKNTPVKTGKLQEGNDFTVETEGMAVIGHLYNDTEYAPYVHEGTSKMQGRPFMKEVVDANESRIAHRFENIV